MLRITLYKKCILNETYQNVISTGLKSGISVLERYLSSLDKYQINDIDYVYQKTEGTLYFDYDINNGDIYEYNYMKVECYSDEDTPRLLFIRYCFIQDIRLDNECVYLDYSEDIWSSYSGKISKITESYLERSRVLNYTNKNISLRTLPIDYDGNNKLVYEELYNSHTVCLFAKMQIYTVGSLGEQQYRTSVNVLLSLKDNAVSKSDFTFSLNDARIFLEQISYYSQSKSAYKRRRDPNLQGPNFYYEVSDIIALNSDFMRDFNFMSILISESQSSYKVFSEVWDTLNNRTVFCGYQLDNFQLKEVSQHNRAYDYKNIKVGNLVHNFDIINNGTVLSYGILLSNSDFEFDVCINYANNIISIKNDYLVEVPFNYLNGEVIAQQKMAREMGNINAGINIAMGAIQTVSEIAGAVGSGGVSLFGTEGVRKTTTLRKKLKSGTIKTTSKSTYTPGTASAMDLIGDSASGVGKVAKGITSLVEINAPVYSTSKNVNTNSNGLLNGYYGLLLYKINPDNENFVKRTINNTGYIVYEYTADLSEFDFNNPSYFETNSINYNVLAFSTINVIGDFPRTIALVLNEILENGVKIWYNENLQDDNLVVG